MCQIGGEYFCIAYSENPRVIKVVCDGYGVIKSKPDEPEQKYLWMTSTEDELDYWKINASDFKSTIFKTKEEALMQTKNKK